MTFGEMDKIEKVRTKGKEKQHMDGIMHNIRIEAAVRTFANVGQALFAVERHSGHIVVYDCGGENVGYVRRAIKRILRPEEPIDVLFISHYDRDHINGIRYLLQHYSVKHLVLPMIEEPVKAMTLCMFGSRSLAYRFCNDPEKEVADIYAAKRTHNEGREDVVMPLIHRIQQEDGERPREEERRGEAVVMDSLVQDTSHPSGTEFVFGHDDKPWVYIPFNRAVMLPRTVEQFKIELGLAPNATYQDIMDKWRRTSSKRNVFKHAWSATTGIDEKGINAYSMTLYSGSKRPNQKTGCLYTGDYDAGRYMLLLYQAYHAVWDNIFIVQIPHHGSFPNFDGGLVIKGGYHVISNKQQPSKDSDVDYNDAVREILHNEGCVEMTWEGDIQIPCIMDHHARIVIPNSPNGFVYYLNKGLK
jgi:hypothetical protein